MPTPALCRPYAGRHPALSPSPAGRGAAAPFAPCGPACPRAPPCPAARRARRIFSPVPRVVIAVTRPREPSTAGEDAKGHVVSQGRGEDGGGCRAVELGWRVPTSLPLSAGGGRAISLSRKVVVKVEESWDNRQGWLRNRHGMFCKRTQKLTSSAELAMEQLSSGLIQNSLKQIPSSPWV